MEEVTNEVLLEKIDNLHEKIEEIKAQVMKTNGEVASLKIWRAIMQGAVSVLTVIVIPLLFIFIRVWLAR